MDDLGLLRFLAVMAPRSGVAPTEAGRVLLRQARGLDEQVATAVRLARYAGSRAPELLVTAPGYDVSVLEQVVTSHNLSVPRAPAVALVVDPHEQAVQLRDGTVDVALVGDQFDDHGLDSDELFSEPRVALLPEQHPLAARHALELAQLSDSPALWQHARDEDGLLWCPPDHGRSNGWARGPAIRDSCQIYAFVRLGHGIAFVLASVSAAFIGCGVRAVRVLDCPRRPCVSRGVRTAGPPLLAGSCDTLSGT